MNVPYHESHSILAYDVWSVLRMVRLTAVAAALAGLVLAGCAGGNFGQAGFSLPAADGVQTVSDAADALDTHRTLASENAKAAIAVTDAMGSFVREISANQRALVGRARQAGHPAMTIRQGAAGHNGKRIMAGSELIMRPGLGVSTYCQSSAGYTVNGIPSLDESFGWQSGAYSGGTRSADARGLAVWSARASGSVVQGAIGGLSLERTGASASCPMNAPAFVLKGGVSSNAFAIPIGMAFRGGALFNLSVADARFANGASLAVTTSTRQPVQVGGVITRGRTQLGSFRTNSAGDGTLTITSTGAQYAIADWIVVGI
jgi:hypothetical protein